MGLFSSIKNGLKKAGSALRGAASQIVNTVKELVNRIVGVVDFLGALIGIRPSKKLRLRIVILRDETGSALASQSDVQPALDRAIAIFKEELNTRIVSAGKDMFHRVDQIPPPAALEPGCGGDAWKDDLGEAGDFYSLHVATNLAAAPTGYATPVTAFIVRNVRGEKGCSLGPLTNYVTLDLAGIEPVTVTSGDDVNPIIGQLWLAHEIAHSCGLWHVADKANLLHKSEETGTKLGRFQKAVARNSRHITYL